MLLPPKPRLKSVKFKGPWFSIDVDDIDWKTILVVAMILGTVIYLVKG